jgi:Protein of unknown function (DUF2523)
MYGILLSAFNTILGFVFRQVVVKFVVLFSLYFVIQEFVGALSSLLPSPSSLSSSFAGVTSGMWWFLDLFGFSQGASLVVAAMAARFLIRRIPLIG